MSLVSLVCPRSGQPSQDAGSCAHKVSQSWRGLKGGDVCVCVSEKCYIWNKVQGRESY